MNIRRLIPMAAAVLAVASCAASPADAQCCGDCNANGMVTIDELVRAVGFALHGCSDDAPCRRFPATGQTVCYEPAGSTVIPCVGATGQDGAVQAGTLLSYTDIGDGTITDNNTRLTWEKKDDNDAGSVHDKDAEYTFADAISLVSPQPPTRVFLDVLNNYCDDDEATPCTSDGDCVGAPDTYASNDLCGHAGHRDWRLPNIRELTSIVDYGVYRPSVDSVFHTACAPGCTVVQCSCTTSLWYWSSTAYRTVPSYAWTVLFDDGHAYEIEKTERHGVRAVCSGL